MIRVVIKEFVNNKIVDDKYYYHQLEFISNKDTKKESDSTLPHISGSKAGELLSSVNNLSQDNNIVKSKEIRQQIEEKPTSKKPNNLANNVMSMSEVKSMIDRVFNANGIYDFYVGKYKNADEWIKDETCFSFTEVGNFNQKEYNNIDELVLPKKEYGKLAHIVDSTIDITPGINNVILSDKIYMVYYKNYNDFKVLKTYNVADYYDEVDINETNRNADKFNKGIETTRGGQNDSKFSNVWIKNRETTTSDDELPSVNKKQDSKQKQSDIKRNRNRKELLDSSFFVEEIKTDNKGRTLTKEQMEYFKDSKVRDENEKYVKAYKELSTAKGFWDKTLRSDKNKNDKIEKIIYKIIPEE